MPTFIDESGDTGPVRNGGKPYFRLAAVWVPTHNAADAFREKVRRLRRELGLRDDYEFKFVATHRQPRHRRLFYEAALSQEFRFAIGSIDKRSGDWDRAESSAQHRACATEIAAALRPLYVRAEQARGTLLKETVVIDDNRDQKFLKVVKEQFRALGSPENGNVPRR